MKNTASTPEKITATKERMNRMAKAINVSSNNMQGSPYWKTCKRVVKVYFKENGITEISFKEFADVSAFSLENAEKMLIEMNADLFAKK